MGKKKITAVSKLEVHWVEKSEYFNTNDEVYFLPIPDNIVENLQWKDGDSLNFEIKDGKIVVTKDKG